MIVVKENESCVQSKTFDTVRYCSAAAAAPQQQSLCEAKINWKRSVLEKRMQMCDCPGYCVDVRELERCVGGRVSPSGQDEMIRQRPDGWLKRGSLLFSSMLFFSLTPSFETKNTQSFSCPAHNQRRRCCFRREQNAFQRAIILNLNDLLHNSIYGRHLTTENVQKSSSELY